MKPANYKCLVCKTVFEHWVGDEETFPSFTECECKELAQRSYTSIATICHQGSVGNQNNGYTSTGGNIKKT